MSGMQLMLSSPYSAKGVNSVQVSYEKKTQTQHMRLLFWQNKTNISESTAKSRITRWELDLTQYWTEDRRRWGSSYNIHTKKLS